MKLVGTVSEVISINGVDATIAREVSLTLGQVTTTEGEVIRVALYDGMEPYGAYNIPTGPVGEEEILKAVLVQGSLTGFVFE